MSGSFQERADLQRRQIFHQQLLDSKSFRNVWPPERHAQSAHESGSDGDFGTGILALAGVILIPLLLFVAALAAALAVTAALPAALTIVVVTRIIWKRALRNVWAVYLAALFGLLSYVSIAAAIAVAIGFLHSPSVAPSFFGQIANALWALAAHSSDALHALGSASVPVHQLLGFGFNGGESIIVRAVALIAFHAPGLLGCAAAFSYWIGTPFAGVRGLLAAFVTSAIIAPASLALTASVGLLIIR